MPSGQVAEQIRLLKSKPEVRYAEPNYILYADSVPNDSYFGQLWGLLNTGQSVQGTEGTPGADIKAVPAWDRTRGTSTVAVGVVDTGIDYTQPDLAANIWSNPGGIGGCPAGTHGYNADSRNPSRDPCDPKAVSRHHGTLIAGTIGAVGNNGKGVVGVNWTKSIMVLKFENEDCLCGTNADAIAAIDFAVQAKQAGVNVRVLNNSYGCCYAGGGKFPYSDALLDEIKKAGANDILFAASAGNVSADNDGDPHYPCSYGDPKAILTPGQTAASNVICVAATDQSDNLADFSNFGPNSVDLGAPGVNILSTLICPPSCAAAGSYGYGRGSSIATAYVTGAAALLLAMGYRPVDSVRSCVLNNVDHLPSLDGRVRTGGRLNLYRVLSGCGPATVPAAPTLTATAGNASVHLAWTSLLDGGSPITNYRVYRGTLSGGEVLLAMLGTVTSYDDNAVSNGTTYYYRVSALNSIGEGPSSTEVSATPQAPSVPGAPRLSAETAKTKGVQLFWTVPASGGSPITGYRIYRGTASGGEASLTSVGGNVTSYTDTATRSGVVHVYYVTAVNAVGEGSPSNEAKALAPVFTAGGAAGSSRCTIVGTAGRDRLVGTPRSDVICAGSGDDTILAGAGDDVVRAGPGQDAIYGGAGNDLLLARDGARDLVVGGPGRDRAAVDGRDEVRSVEVVLAPTPKPPPTRAYVVAAAGDIACDPGDPGFNGGQGSASSCQQLATSDLVLALKPDAVLTLGDNQYNDSTYEKYLLSFDPSWGRFKSLIHPAIGNHEYLDPAGGAAGYFRYFGAAAREPGKGYYSFDLGRWHIVSLNTECLRVGGCDPGSPEEQWLRADLAAHPARCTLAYWHYPRWRSGRFPDVVRADALVRDLYAAGAELILSGHAHNYERFAPQDPNGRPDAERGLRQFVVGSGGRNLSPSGPLAANSEVRTDTTFGVLKLVLKPGGYEWQFLPVGGSGFTDSGSGSCH